MNGSELTDDSELLEAFHVHWLSTQSTPHSGNSSFSSDASNCGDSQSVAAFKALFANWVEHQEELRHASDDRDEDTQENAGVGDSGKMDEGNREEKDERGNDGDS